MTKKQIGEEIQSITQQLIEKYKPAKIILFGSAARGNFGPNSDLDFLIIKDDAGRHLEVEQRLHRMINYKIASDFIFLTPKEVKRRLKKKDFFLQEIFRKGKVLHG